MLGVVADIPAGLSQADCGAAPASCRPGHHWALAPPGRKSGLAGVSAPCAPSPPLNGNFVLLSPLYIVHASPNCFSLLWHLVPCAWDFDLARAGSSIAARMAMIAITTSNSIRV